MSKSSYNIQHTESSFCPNCRITVDLLSPDILDGPVLDDIKQMLPAFYICKRCGFIGEIGVGKINGNLQEGFLSVD